jgi:serine/threonine protein phosphatase PrpC
MTQVGDSRGYLIRNGRMRRVTRRHSLVDKLVRSGELTPQEALHHPQRNVITRALGVKQPSKSTSSKSISATRTLSCSARTVCIAWSRTAKSSER